MPKVMKICKACGKQYEACHTPPTGAFRWQDVACSPECAQKYFHDVMVARGEIVEQQSEETVHVAADDSHAAADVLDQSNDVGLEEPAQAESFVRTQRHKKK